MKRRTAKVLAWLVSAGALLAVTASVSLAGGDAEAGDEAFDQRDYRMAVVHYQRALRDQPGDPHLLAALAQSYERWGQLERARELAEEAAAADSRNVVAHMILARADEREGRWTQARARYERALLADPGNRMAQAGLVHALRARGDVTAARAARSRFERSQ